MLELFEMSNAIYGKMGSIPVFLYYLATADESEIDWFVDGWRGEDVLSIVKWTEDELYSWALHVDLDAVGTTEEVAILPFPWAEEHDPEVVEGIYAWRLFAEKRIR